MVVLRRHLRKLDCFTRSFSTTSSTLKAKRKSRDKKVHFNQQAYRQPPLKVDTRHAQDLLVKDKRSKKSGGIQSHDDSDIRLNLLFLVYCVQQISDSKGASFVAADGDDAAETEKVDEREGEQPEDRNFESAKSQSRSSTGKAQAGSASGRGRKLRGRQRREPIRESPQQLKVEYDIAQSNLRQCISLYTQHFRPLIQAEEMAEKNEIQDRLKDWPLEELVSKGYTLIDLLPRLRGWQVSMGRQVYDMIPQQYCNFDRFKNGAHVVLSYDGPKKIQPVIGSVIEQSESSVTVVVQKPLLEDKRYRIDQAPNDTSFKRMKQALAALKLVFQTSGKEKSKIRNKKLAAKKAKERRLIEHAGFVGSPLTDTLVGATKEWSERQLERPSVPNDDPLQHMNPSQREAIAKLIRHRFSLIQGPPGTGKTTTVIDAIHFLKQMYKVPGPILITGATNVAIDNILDGIMQKGITFMRAGPMDKIRPHLQVRSIDYLFDQHPKKAEYLAAKIEQYKFSQTFDKKGKNRVSVKTMKELDKKERALFKEIMKDISDVDVICTTCVSAGNAMLRTFKFSLVLIDEGSLVTEPGALIPLMKGAAHACIIGDHRQLPPLVKSSTDSPLAYSLFERFSENDVAPMTMLNVQYRMHPGISEFPSMRFYNSMISNGPNVSEREPFNFYLFRNAADFPVAFVNHANRETAADETSVKNTGEAEIVQNLLVRLFSEHSELEGKDVSVIASYSAQVREIKEKLLDYITPLGGLHQNILQQKMSNVEVNTVDGFQGCESEVIIYSTVRNNKRGYIGFLQDERRMNVALTRARRALVVVGSIDTLQKSDSGAWNGYVEWLQQRDLVVQNRKKG